MTPRASVPLAGVLLVALLLVASDLSAAAATGLADKAAAVVGESKVVHGCRHGCCGVFRGRCIRCCPPL
ncbi:hypothetical protein Taro_038753 [Colocasia esculenta]|uniref:Uncharacterized protein n=1 Tax=Colocasia esculenta TaxID=4460 RepID=A0A843WER7_COLES|nr:hypothetical protein [Colocasia esculenta]